MTATSHAKSIGRRADATVAFLVVLVGGARCATHSPILAATPGADIIELDEHGFRRTTWEDLQLVDHWRRYLAQPDHYLRHLLAPDDGEWG